MKKLLGILVLGVLWCNAGISDENRFLNINLPSEHEWQKIEIIEGDKPQFKQYWEMIFYAQVKESKTVALLEILNVTGFGPDFGRKLM